MKSTRKTIFYLICCLLIQGCLLSGSSLAITPKQAYYLNNEHLAPYLQIERTALQNGFFRFAENRSFFELRQADEKRSLNSAEVLQPGITRSIHQKSALLAKLIEEKNNPGTVVLPRIIVMSDFHGEIDLFLTYVADAISQHLKQQIFLDHSVFPDSSIEEQLKFQGIDIKNISNLRFNLLGDFSDRGRYGIKCVRAAQELKQLGIAEVVTGNHDLLEFLASIGYHLPIYKGYDFYGSVISEQLVEQHWNDEEISKDRFGWWSGKLAEYVKVRLALQQGSFLINGQIDIKEIRKQLKQIYMRIKDQLDDEELALWEDLTGFYFGSTDVYTGFNAVGMMSVEWWQQRSERVNVFLEAARQRAQNQETKKESQHQILIWEYLREYTDAAYLLVKKQADDAKGQGKWWHQVFNDINHQAYASPQWYAMDWIFHSGWGTSVIAELNELETDEKISWNAANFMNNKHIKNFALFSRENFTLYIKDEFGNYYTHGWFPVSSLDGTIGFTYKDIVYQGKDLWKGLEILQSDVRNKPLDELKEAFNLVMSWYADKTTTIKPENIKGYIDKWGIEKIQESIGAHLWFTCHNPLNKLQLYGIGFKMQEGDYAHISVDKGMSWKKFKDVGGYVQVETGGIKLRGFGGVKFKEIIDHPPTMTLVEDEIKGWYEKEIWENEPLTRDDFLNIAITQMQEELQELKGIRPVSAEAGKRVPISKCHSFIEHAI
ncbi:MAG: hypothetical protein V1739_02840 [Candidatus Omnitrophota bacterium]